MDAKLCSFKSIFDSLSNKEQVGVKKIIIPLKLMKINKIKKLKEFRHTSFFLF